MVTVLSDPEIVRKTVAGDYVFWNIAIQYMFCVFLMIKKMSLEGFTSTGEAKYEG